MIQALLALALGCSGEAGNTGGDSAVGADSDTDTDTGVPRTTFAVDTRDVQWVTPPDIGQALSAIPVLVGIRQTKKQAADPETIDLVVRLGNGTNDKPAITSDARALILTATLAKDGHFVFGPQDIEEKGTDAVLIVEDLYVGGTLTPDLTAMTSIDLTGRLDVRGIYFPGGYNNPYAWCDFAAKYGGECGECRDGASRCVSFEAHEERARLLSDVTVYEMPFGYWCGGMLVPPIGLAWLRRRRRTARA